METIGVLPLASRRLSTLEEVPREPRTRGCHLAIDGSRGFHPLAKNFVVEVRRVDPQDPGDVERGHEISQG